MLSRTLKPIAFGVFAAGLALSSLPVQADPLPNLTNLNFLSYTGATPKNYFTAVNPTGWSPAVVCSGMGRGFCIVPH